MATFTHDGIDIHYEDSGMGRPPVVFSHGFLMDREMFDPQVYALSNDYRCITWDQRGHGTTRATGPFTYWDSAKDLLALLDHLDIDSAVLVGMSQGGFVSMRAALEAPDRVKGLVFIDSQAGQEDEDKKPVYEALFQQWVTEGPTRDAAQMVADIILGPNTKYEPWIEKWMALENDQVEYIYRTLVDRDDLWDRVAEIDIPALVIHGNMDIAISLDKAERLAELLPQSGDVAVVTDAGHSANLGNPDAVNDALRAFLKGT
jgi:3-oxoadipate enol-lactonase